MTEKKPLAASGAEVIFLLLLVILGIGLCGLVEKNFTSHWPEPTEQRAFESPRVKEKQDALTGIENSIKETEKQHDIAALDQLKQETVQRTLKTLNPGLGDPPASGISVSPEAEKNYQAARTQEHTAIALQKSFTNRIAVLKQDAEKIGQELKLEKQMAIDKLGGERKSFLFAKFAASVLGPLLVVAIVFLVGAAVLSLFAGKWVWAIRGLPPFLFVLGVLLILLAYKVLEIAGAALIGIIVLLILLQRIKWAPKIKEKVN